MRKSPILGIGLVLFALCLPHASAQDKKQSADPQPMSADDYSFLLDQLQSDLDKWEPVLRNIDPGKGDVSYKVGLQIAKNKKVALLQIRNARAVIAQQKTKRSIYGELALGGFVSTLSIQFEELALADALNDLSVAGIGIFAAEMGLKEEDLMNDGMKRLKLLESGNCFK